MNIYLKLFCIILLLSSFSFAQRRHEREGDPRIKEKIEQLEKIKLIETLNLEEETAIRFFSRRTFHQSEIKNIMEQIDEVVVKLDQMDKSGRMISESEYTATINQFTGLHLKLEEKNAEFVAALNEILSYNQIARYIVFQRKFKDELRKAIFEEKRKPRSE